MQEVAIVERLQTQKLELEIAFRLQRRSDSLEVETRKFRIEQFGIDAGLDIGAEIVGVTRGHVSLRCMRRAAMDEGQDFSAQLVEQQTGAHEGVVRFLLHQGARGHDAGQCQLIQRDAVIEIAAGFLEHRDSIDAIEAGTGLVDDQRQTRRIERRARAVGERDMQHWRGGDERRLGGQFLRAGAGALLAIQHISARHLVMLAAHQRQFDLVLHILDMEGAPLPDTARQRGHDVTGELFHRFMNAARRGSGVALDGEERLGHRHGNLAAVEGRHGAVAADNLHRGFARRRSERFRRQLNRRRMGRIAAVGQDGR